MADEKPVYLTEQGRQELVAELEHLRMVKRPEVAARISQAKEYGDISENSEYEDAKNEQAFTEGRIRTIESLLNRARLIKDDMRGAPGTVRLGTRVTTIDDTDEREAGEVVAFDDELGADDDVDLAFFDLAQGLAQIADACLSPRRLVGAAVLSPAGSQGRLRTPVAGPHAAPADHRSAAAAAARRHAASIVAPRRPGGLRHTACRRVPDGRWRSSAPGSGAGGR